MQSFMEIRARTRVQFVNPVLTDCLRRHAVLFQYAGIEPDWSEQGCFFTVRDDFFPMPRQLSDFSGCLIRFFAGYNTREDVTALREALDALGPALTDGYTGLSIDLQALLTGSYAARFNVRPASYALDYYTAILRHIADRNDLPLEAVTRDRFVRAVRHVPARVSAFFTFDGTQSIYLRTYRLQGLDTTADPLVKRVRMVYDAHNQPRQALTYDARVRPTAPRPAGVDYARQIGPKPRSLDFTGKNFVLTGGDKPALTREITARGGCVRSSLVLATDYLIIGDAVRRETAKITRAKALNTSRPRQICALWEHEFWQLCAQTAQDREPDAIAGQTGQENPDMP